MNWKKKKKSWLVFKWDPDLPLGVRWHHHLSAENFIEGETTENLPPASEVQVLLLLPGQDVTLHSFRLATRRHEALAWQLEPLLLSEMQQIHSVSLEQNGDQHLMGVIARKQLLAYLDKIRALGYEPQRALPVTLLLNAGSNMPDGDVVHIRLASGDGMTLQHEHWPLLCSIQPLLMETEAQPEKSLAQLATAAITSGYNLLQHDFRPRLSRATTLSMPLIATSLFILSVFAEPLWQGLQYQQQTRHLAVQIQARYPHYSPDGQTTELREQMQRKLDVLRDQPSPSSLSLLLHLSTPLINTLLPQRWKKVQWDAGTQQLRIDYEQPVERSMLPAVPPRMDVKVGEQYIMMSIKNE